MSFNVFTFQPRDIAGAVGQIAVFARQPSASNRHAPPASRR